MTPQELAADIAAELRAHPERWTKHAMARDSGGGPCDANSPHAVCWCLIGHGRKRHMSLPQEFYHLVNTGLIGSKWNDTKERTVDDVISLCDAVAGMP